jgi:AcrR family transcriptional regulator
VAKESIDRRIRKTREALHRALMSLMLEKDYDSIVVKQILERADVGRSTFYMHFDDKEGLLLGGLEGMDAELRQAQSAAAPFQARKQDRAIAFSLAMFRHAYEHRDLYRALISGRAWDIVRPRIEKMLVDLITKEAGPLFKKRSSIPFDLFTRFLGSAFMSVLAWWLNQRNPIPPEEMNEVFRQLVGPMLATNLA